MEIAPAVLTVHGHSHVHALAQLQSYVRQNDASAAVFWGLESFSWDHVADADARHRLKRDARETLRAIASAEVGVAVSRTPMLVMDFLTGDYDEADVAVAVHVLACLPKSRLLPDVLARPFFAPPMSAHEATTDLERIARDVDTDIQTRIESAGHVLQRLVHETPAVVAGVIKSFSRGIKNRDVVVSVDVLVQLYRSRFIDAHCKPLYGLHALALALMCKTGHAWHTMLCVPNRHDAHVLVERWRVQ